MDGVKPVLFVWAGMRKIQIYSRAAYVLGETSAVKYQQNLLYLLMLDFK